MSLLSVFALASAMFILALTPGAGVFATVSRAVTSGLSHASVVVLGIVIGDVIFLLFAIFGLSLLAESLGNLFVFVKYAGGSYLIWLGFIMWTSDTTERTVDGVLELSWMENFLSGLLITLGNPKVILFYLGFLPTFIDLDRLTVSDMLIVISIVAIVLGGVMMGYAVTADRARLLFSNQQGKQRMNRLAGAVMAVVGGVLIAGP